MLRATFILTILILLSLSSQAHVTISPNSGQPGQVLNTAFHVPHGCNGSATTSIKVSIPDTVTSVQAKDVDGWNLLLGYRQLSQPIQMDGKSVNQTINSITWSGGKLASDKNQDFGFQISLPQVDLSNQPNATIYFPVEQTCINATTEWIGIPGTASFADNKAHPAPEIVITKEVSTTLGQGQTSGQERYAASSACTILSVVLFNALWYSLL